MAYLESVSMTWHRRKRVHVIILWNDTDKDSRNYLLNKSVHFLTYSSLSVLATISFCSFYSPKLMSNVSSKVVEIIIVT